MTDTLARALAPSDTGIDRRKLLKMGVWAAPVVVLATAAPAAASSPEPALTLTVTEVIATPGTAGSGQNARETLSVKTTVSVSRNVKITAYLAPTTSHDGTWANTTGTTAVVVQDLVAGVNTVQFPLFTRANNGAKRPSFKLSYYDDTTLVREQTVNWPSAS